MEKNNPSVTQKILKTAFLHCITNIVNDCPRQTSNLKYSACIILMLNIPSGTSQNLKGSKSVGGD